jgi:hypothetical protein
MPVAGDEIGDADSFPMRSRTRKLERYGLAGCYRICSASENAHKSGHLVINFRCLSTAQDLTRLTFQFDAWFLMDSLDLLIGPINFFLYGIDCPNERREEQTYVILRYSFHMLDQFTHFSFPSWIKSRSSLYVETITYSTTAIASIKSKACSRNVNTVIVKAGTWYAPNSWTNSDNPTAGVPMMMKITVPTKACTKKFNSGVHQCLFSDEVCSFMDFSYFFVFRWQHVIDVAPVPFITESR